LCPRAFIVTAIRDRPITSVGNNPWPSTTGVANIAVTATRITPTAEEKPPLIGAILGQ